ncbi:autotransporter [Streptomyces sp. TRM66268-LWL]|uniref:Autotransporter n=1 Tax=Streptomyces polyasparticus TaxID=2767826 RepID=A0ABR7S920_9ACTN|nr:autotransporter [Streptomyces polyasparticus]
MAGAPPARAAGGSGDLTADVLAGRDVRLTGDAVVRLPGGTHTYRGVFSGEGTLRIAGTGTLVLVRDSDFTLPKARQRQRVRVQGGNHPYVTVHHPDSPAVTVERGATLQYGDGGTAGQIAHYPYNTPAYRQNQNNIRVDGTLRLSLTSAYNLGTISGSGLLTQPRFLWGRWDLSGTHPDFTGTIDNGTQLNAGAPEFATSLPGVRKILNQGTWTVDTPLGQTVTQRMDFYQREYGSDINVQSRPGSKVVLTGQYSWADGGSDRNPTLSDPALNWRPAHKNINKRGTNIKGANLQWGDGTTDKIFMPGTAETVYINLLAARERSRLTFAYNGPVTLGAPIGGGVFHDTLSAPGQGDIVIKGVRGNDVTFAARQYYDGTTTVEKGAVLRLGSGKAGGDSELYQGGSRYGLTTDGTLIAQNTDKPLTLSAIGGSGALAQAGRAPLRLTGAATYTGTTTVRRGALELHRGTLAASRAVRLTGKEARLDLTRAGDQTLRSLDAVAGSEVIWGGKGRLTLRGTGKGVAGTLRGGELYNSGALQGSFILHGDFRQAKSGELTVRAGDTPPKVSGEVSLAGRLVVRPPKGEAPDEPVLLALAGERPATGAFTGLREGARVTVASAEYRLTYRGGDGNDVALVRESASAKPGAAREAVAASGPVSEADGSGSWLWTAAGAAGAAVVLVLAALLIRRRTVREAPAAGRHRAR